MAALSARDKLNSFEIKRKNLEIEIKDQLDTIPQEFRDTTKKARYVDAEGFPRPDVDIWSISTVRKKVIMLQNDHIAIMKQIELLLLDAFKTPNNKAHKTPQSHTEAMSNDYGETEKKAAAKDNAKESLLATLHSENPNEKQNIIDSMKAFITNAKNEEAAHAQNESESAEEDMASLKPMYVIDKIFENSPSRAAGLKTGDRVLKFGSMTESNHSAQLMRDIVRQSVDKEIPVIVLRNPEGFCSLKLVPRKWDGKGLLGCHLTPC